MQNGTETPAPEAMKTPRPSKTELRILEVLWTRGASSIREIQESFAEKSRPAYTTVQTLVYRLETKKALRRVKKPGSVNLFEAVISRQAAQRNFIDDFLGLFGGQMQPMMTQLIETGKLTLEDIQAAEKTLRLLKEKKP
jgi:BlaI family penicillinase repressor